MKFSESWLREWVNPAMDTEALVSLVTMAGLEVDAVEPAAAAFSGVVVGEIITAEPHPDADKLRVCRVAGHPDGEQQVVCGAPNARPGIRVPFATVGAVLPGDFSIKKAKLRGVESFGMLCAGDELGVEVDGDGLWELPSDAPVGGDLRAYLALDDNIIEVDLTPNRGDCLSIKGLAREVGALCELPVAPCENTAVAPVCEDRHSVSLEAGDKCPRYVGRVIRNVDVSARTPLWIVEKLRRAGVRAIDPVVDVTNYVLQELGQPMHAFDLAKLRGDIVVRASKAGEAITLLDGSEKTLDEGTLLITDASGPIALAGVMGGESTAVGETTRDIFLESAFFHPLAIVGQARQYGLHTDSSHRFERGVAPDLCIEAMERATALLLSICGGEPGPTEVHEVRDALPPARTVTLRRERLNQQLACALPAEVVVGILSRLGCDVLDNGQGGWAVTVPSWRFDIAIEADLVEEVARVYGYNRLPTTDVIGALGIEPCREARLPQHRLRTELAARGFREAITYSFVDPKIQRLLDPEGQAVAVANPISSDLAVMRTTLWSGLITALNHNLNRQQNRVRLFESGLRFRPGADGLAQEPVIAGLIYGDRDDENWTAARGSVDFYDIKGHVEALVALTGNAGNCRFEASSIAALHPGQSAALYKGDCLVGHLGCLHPSVQKQLDIDHPVFLFELALESLLDGELPRFSEVSRYPGVRRDIAVVVDREVSASALLDTVRQHGGDYLRDLKIFDVYAGKGIETTRKSIALGLTFQEESRTLNESEVNAAVDAVIEALRTEYKATLRG